MNKKANKAYHETLNDSIVIDQELGADGKEAGVEAEPEIDIALEPFDPRSISIDAKVIAMDTVIRRILQGTIRLAPAFQRQVVWDETRQSQLIESLMLRIPLPMFYVAADENGNWDVVDGLQRLTTLKRFILGDEYLEKKNDKLRGVGLRLKNLEFWGEQYNTATFSQLPPAIANNIMEAELRFTIINPGTPDEVKFTIFKRINTGGLPLSAQEIRHALYQGPATLLLEQLVNTSEYKKATDGSVNDSRMAGREICLRFLAFTLRKPTDYKKSDMDQFLNETMRILNYLPNKDTSCLGKAFNNSNLPKLQTSSINELEARFKRAMTRSHKLFKTHAFRKAVPPYKRPPINKTLFETWGNILADLPDAEYEVLLRRKKLLLTKYGNLIENTLFTNLLARDSWKVSAVQDRYRILNELIHSIITGEN